MKKNKLKGFTLIELIVVIAIIGILAAILIPSMLGYAKNARVSRCNANAKSIYAGAQLALTDIVKAGGTLESDAVYICISEGSGICEEANGNRCDITDYIGNNFDGYFGFITNAEGSGCLFAIWSEYELEEDMFDTQLSMTEIKALAGSGESLRGYHPIAPEADGASS